jgi:hypothetical protein
MTEKVTLEWVELEDGCRALAFDAKTWAVFERSATAKGKTARQLISAAVIKDPDFLRLHNQLRGDFVALEWVEPKDGSRALVFDPKTWAVFEQSATAKGKTAHQLITTAVTTALGPILMDNYT